jgi:hypothetical protein
MQPEGYPQGRVWKDMAKVRQQAKKEKSIKAQKRETM